MAATCSEFAAGAGGRGELEPTNASGLLAVEKFGFLPVR